MPKHWISLLILVTLTLLFVVFWESPPAILSAPKAAPNATFPASYLVNSHSRQYDEDGTLGFEMRAKKIVHYQASPGKQQDTDFAQIESPQLLLHNSGAEPWHISAKRGKSNHNGSRLTLIDDVYAWQINKKGERNELNTDELVLLTEQQYVETNKAVIIAAPGHTITAIGLKANLQKDSLQLLSRVRGVHEFKK